MGLQAKFEQSHFCRNFLIKTEKTIIVEASKHDKFFGVGVGQHDKKIGDKQNWKGDNYMGKALMKTKARLKILTF